MIRPDEDETRSVTRDYYFSIIPEALLNTQVSSKAYHLYGLLDRYAGENRLAYPSRKTLARRLRCSLTTVDRAIDELVAAGFLTVKPSYRANGGKQPSHYFLHTDSADLTHGDGADLTHQDVSSVTHTHGAEMTHGDGADLMHDNESQEEGELEESRARRNESHADCVVSVVPSPGLQLISSQPEDSGDTLQDFSGEAAPSQPLKLRDMSEELPQPKLKPKRSKSSKSKPKQSDELAEALAKADPVLVRELFDAWAETGNGKSHHSDERLGLIARAIVVWEFPPEDVRDALTGWVNDPWEERPRFKDVKYLLGSVEKVETFRDLKRRGKTRSLDRSAGLTVDASDQFRYESFDPSTAFGRKQR